MEASWHPNRRKIDANFERQFFENLVFPKGKTMILNLKVRGFAKSMENQLKSQKKLSKLSSKLTRNRGLGWSGAHFGGLEGAQITTKIKGYANIDLGSTFESFWGHFWASIRDPKRHKNDAENEARKRAQLGEP